MSDLLPNSDVLHVYPINDLIDHELVGDGCVCGVTIQPVPVEGGGMRWLNVHHSLDGRELHEKDGR